jgi:membrane protein DedA with SNARE-associated domain
MLEFVLGDLSGLIAAHGLWIVALVIGLESMGLPLPGETCLVTAAIYAGATGNLSLVSVIAAATAGAVVGDSLGFWIGRSIGQRALIRHGSRIGITPEKIKLGRYLFLRHGGKVVFLGRFVAVLRVLAALLAGANRMAWPRFFLFNATGGLVWATVFACGAYFFGSRIEAVTGPVGITLLVLATGGLVWLVVLLRKHEARLLKEAERAFPVNCYRREAKPLVDHPTAAGPSLGEALAPT